MKTIQLTIDGDTLDRYDAYYFALHPKAHCRQIAHPYHESINQWMIMKRMQMNALKQKWLRFMIWFVGESPYSGLRIKECELEFMTYYPSNRRHDIDNSVPKFILDGLCESGLIVDDDHLHIQKLTLGCGVDKSRPRTEITINILAVMPDESKEEKTDGKETGTDG